MLTVPKSKDLVYKLRYNDEGIDDMINTSSVTDGNSSINNTISDTISNAISNNTISDTITNTISNNTISDTITNTISNNMELELEQFLQSVKSTHSTQSLPVN